jgi:hypothetical protein
LVSPLEHAGGDRDALDLVSGPEPAYTPRS